MVYSAGPGASIEYPCRGRADAVTDSRPGRGIGARAAVTDTGKISAKIVNERPFCVLRLLRGIWRTAPSVRTPRAAAALAASVQCVACRSH
jgi:hypothetical protein